MIVGWLVVATPAWTIVCFVPCVCVGSVRASVQFLSASQKPGQQCCGCVQVALFGKEGPKAQAPSLQHGTTIYI